MVKVQKIALADVAHRSRTSVPPHPCVLLYGPRSASAGGSRTTAAHGPNFRAKDARAIRVAFSPPGADIAASAVDVVRAGASSQAADKLH